VSLLIPSTSFSTKFQFLSVRKLIKSDRLFTIRALADKSSFQCVVLVFFVVIVVDNDDYDNNNINNRQ
jgi:hypothetical protein